MAKKNQTDSTYTYRGGRKLPLRKLPDQFVVRRLPDELPLGLDGEQVSGASSRVKCAPGERDKLMAETREVAVAHHAYQMDKTGEDFLITDRVIVSFKEPPSVDQLGAFTAKYGLQVVEAYSDRDFLLRLTDHTGMNPVKLVVLLTEREDLLAAVDHDLNMIAKTSQIALPTDPSYQAQWHLHQRQAAAADYDPRSSAMCEQAWQALDGFGGSEVVVGVTDDGCQLDHPDFDSPGKFAGWGYFQGNTLVRMGDAGADPARMYEDGSNHGTSCAGVIAAEVDAQLTVGAAPGCRLAPIKWESDGPSLFISDSKLRTALDYLSDKVDIVSNSWGITPISTWSLVTRNRIRQLAQNGGRRGLGIVFLWAAGNENCPISHVANQDVPFDNGWNPSLTAWVGVTTAREFRNDLVGIPGVMHVAALGSTAQRSHYSNYGTGIMVCAPSSNSHKYRRLALPGRGIVTTRGRGAVETRFGGTSSATPLVAGVAALVISANDRLSGFEVISVIKRTASKDLNMTGWPRTPPAPFNQDTSWDVSPVAPFDSGAFQNIGSEDGTWSPWFGHGKVDAAAAVAQARILAGDRTVHLAATSSSEVSIPDNNPVGVVSRLNIAEDGLIRAIKVTVDIAHTFIGDLVVRLVGPNSQGVDLHRRTGSGTVNLRRTYDQTTTPGLGGFVGTEIRGIWTLEIMDLASLDQGTLRQWKIEADISRDGALRVGSSPGLVIPDNDPTGISDSISVADARAISDIEVEIDITHPFIGDLTVELKGPASQTAVLHNRSGFGEDNISRTFGTADTASLLQFLGRPAAGLWTLSVADLAGQDVGKLNHWGLAIR